MLNMPTEKPNRYGEIEMQGHSNSLQLSRNLKDWLLCYAKHSLKPQVESTTRQEATVRCAMMQNERKSLVTWCCQ